MGMRDLAFILGIAVFGISVLIAKRQRVTDLRPLITGFSAGAAAIGLSDLFIGSDKVVAYVLLIFGLSTFVLGAFSLTRSRPQGRRWLIAPAVLFLTLCAIAFSQIYFR